MLNKKIKVGLLALLGVLSLAACDEIIAKPSDYETPIVTVDGYNEDIFNDIMSVIYKKIRNNNFGKDVLDEILFEYATSIIGKYNSVTPDARSSAAQDTISLKKAYEGISYLLPSGTPSGDANTDAFIDAHKAYWTIDQATGERKTDSASKIAEYNRVVAKWNTIEERICEAINDEFTSSSSYVYRSYYSEEAYLRNLRGSLYNVKNPDDSGFVKGYNIFISPDAEPTDIFNYLHREYYQTSDEYPDATTKGSDWNTYVEDKIIPNIYQQLLIEQYLLDKSYNTLGGSFARRINVIAIPENAKYPKAAKSLADALIEEIHEEPTGTFLPVDTLDENFANEGLDLFKDYSKTLNGANLQDWQVERLESLLKYGGFEKKTVNNNVYYGGTEYGDVLDNYQKIKDDPKTTDTSVESDFTNSGAYTKETGLMIKEREVERKDHTTTGWFIEKSSSSELSALPESIRTRLFLPQVADQLDLREGENSDTTRDRWQYDEDTQEWNYNANRDKNNVVARINSRFYLKNDKAVAEDYGDGRNDILFYDSGTKTYYVVQVCEACNTSKLKKNGRNNYAELRSSARMEDIVNDVLKVVGKQESYKTTSTKYWLKQAGIEYHDQVVYDYFLNNYPELFD